MAIKPKPSSRLASASNQVGTQFQLGIKTASKLIMHLAPFLVLLGGVSSSLCQVVGSPYGFAKGVTGGGNATPQKPKDIAQYVLQTANNITY